MGPEGPGPDLSLPANHGNISNPVPEPQCPPCAYISADYLLWRLKDPRFPGPLLTTNQLRIATSPVSGALGQPDTITLCDKIGYNPQSGGSLTAGVWLDCHHVCAWEASGFVLERRPSRFELATDNTGFPFMAIPFFNAITGMEDRIGIFNQNRDTGAVLFQVSNRLWGAESNFLTNTPGIKWGCCCGGLSLFTGFRYLDFDEQFTGNYTQNQLVPLQWNAGTVLPGAPLPLPAGTQIQVVDLFRTHNQFFGGQIGGRWSVSCCHLFAAAEAKIAAGDMHESVVVEGSSTAVVQGALPVTVPGGALALQSNEGRHKRDVFAFVPQGEARVGWQFSPNFSIYGAYQFLYFSNVLRAGDQVDRVLDPRQIPNGNFFPNTMSLYPRVLFLGNNFWAQGVNIGMEVIF
jgi:hypothetical protein